MTRVDAGLRRLFVAQWQQEVKTEKRSNGGTLVVVEIGSAPLVCDREVETTVPVDISRSDSSTDLRLVQSEVSGKVVVTAILRPHEERVVIVTAHVVARLEAGPASRVVQELIVAHRQF